MITAILIRRCPVWQQQSPESILQNGQPLSCRTSEPCCDRIRYRPVVDNFT